MTTQGLLGSWAWDSGNSDFTAPVDPARNIQPLLGTPAQHAARRSPAPAVSGEFPRPRSGSQKFQEHSGGVRVVLDQPATQGLGADAIGLSDHAHGLGCVDSYLAPLSVRRAAVHYPVTLLPWQVGKCHGIPNGT